MHYKLLSFQPSSIYQNGGCGRLLRRLYAGREKDIISIEINTYKHSVVKGPIEEKNIFLFPPQKKWMRWKLRNINAYLQKNVFTGLTKVKIHKIVSQYHYDIVHIVNQGLLSAYLCQDKYIRGKKLWVSFHDHYSVGSNFNDAKKLWCTANRRFAISKELAEEYSRTFGEMSYEIITDGLKPEEISVPKKTVSNPIVIYFGGLLHNDYKELFRVMVNVLNKFSEKKQFKLILRGVQHLNFLDNCNFTLEYRNDFVSDEQIKHELDEADILYLPIKFTDPGFYKYSLSTKMIGYLGAAGGILYHGPKESAAGNLLLKYNAAVNCTSLQEQDLINAFEILFTKGSVFSANSKDMVIKNFLLQKIQEQFWKN